MNYHNFALTRLSWVTCNHVCSRSSQPRGAHRPPLGVGRVPGFRFLRLLQLSSLDASVPPTMCWAIFGPLWAGVTIYL